MSLFSGVCPAIVTDNRDPEGIGRVKVQLQSGLNRPDKIEEWARVATLAAGPKSGSWFPPDVGSEVLVAFAGEEAKEPFVIGALWSDSNPPPASVGANNNRKLLRSRNGVTITFDDEIGQEHFIIETPGGQRLTLKDGPGAIEIADSNGNSIKLEPSGMIVNASATVKINASQVEISAGMIRVDAGMAKFSGVVQCDTLISNSVVSASYTPGAGNIW